MLSSFSKTGSNSETITLIPSFGWTTYKDVKIRLYVYCVLTIECGSGRTG